MKKAQDPQVLETVEALERGEIPPAAARRLKENADRQGTPQQLFTSNLSPNELVLTHQCGYEPLGQVMGTTVHYVGYWYTPYSSTTGTPISDDVRVVTQAYEDARRLTFNRLTQEAELLRADGVVGVRFEALELESTEGLIEFKAVGTAVRRTHRLGPPQATPFISNLNGQDHWALRKAGWDPIGFAFGMCNWFQRATGQASTATLGGILVPNVEVEDYTQGVYQAREIALGRLENEARALGAIGVVGVQILPKFESFDYGNNSTTKAVRAVKVQFMVYGTAVRRAQGRYPELGINLTVPLLN